MVIDIHGWIEFQPYPIKNKTWKAVCDAGVLLGCNYDMFGLLFGVNNYANFEPLFPGRGMPENRSKRILENIKFNYYPEARDSDYHSASFATLGEINAIDWQLKAKAADERIHAFEKNKEGLWVYIHKFEGSTEVEFPEGEDQITLISKTGIPTLYRRDIVLTRLDALTTDWKQVFAIMRVIGQQYTEPDRVRLVVWFDN